MLLFGALLEIAAAPQRLDEVGGRSCGRGGRAARLQPLGGNVAGSSINRLEGFPVCSSKGFTSQLPLSGGVEEIGKVRRVVLGQEGGLERGKVGEEDPVPAADQDILDLDVAVADLKEH